MEVTQPGPNGQALGRVRRRCGRAGCWCGWVDAAATAGTRQSAFPSPGLSFPAGAPPTLPGPCRPANPRSRADLPLVLSWAWQRGSGGNLGSRWRCAANEGQKLRAGWVLSQREAAECPRRGPRSAQHPPVSCGGPPARESGPWEPQPVDSPRSPRVLSAEAGCQLFGLGWKVSNGVGDSGPLNVDYLVRLSRTQKTHDLVSIRGLIHSTEQSGRSPGGEIRGWWPTWEGASNPERMQMKA
ncbi:uncharacterized protein LOC117013225 [Rhinolophus ferrumequinum]|uniref:uncharacterized protein LOC117013225 n=1 Tax=Rhinolophus ferrumequinum TaxID=59479 RepID=UPI00140F8F9F|nr:uncharacterized protein LOC117013225 [Rhinolophus ferrumequinum]